MSEGSSPRSPLYERLHTDRYERQAQIREIENRTGRRLLVYFANASHPNSGISPEDVLAFGDLIWNCEPGSNVDLLLQSPGGDVDAAEKLVFALRERIGGLRVVVTDRAKSAATLMALASDEILMSHLSELGPIDPQITTFTPDGKQISRPAHSYLDGLEEIKKYVREEGHLNPAYYPLLSHLDPALLDFCLKALSRSEQFAEKWLTAHMLSGESEKAKDIAHKLATDKEFITSHGKVIGPDDAVNLGLKVAVLDPGDDLWGLFWRLHLTYDLLCRQRTAAKVFETKFVSLVLS